MRAALLLVLALGNAARAEEDDPKWARSSREPESWAAGEDDPKLARSGHAVLRHSFAITHYVPRFKLAYRRLTTAGLDTPIDFNVVELDYYPSSGYFRFGLDTELGIGPTNYGAWFFTVGANVGFQWPWRVTPFLDARFVAGLIGASYMGQGAVSWIYMGGLEAGVEVYVASRFYFTAALGWAHPVWSGIDVAYVRAHPMLDPMRKDLANDTFTFKLGLGL
jgi:hypothetical protein